MPTSNFVKYGKVSMIIDGQFGSTGKGAIAARIAMDNHIHVACGTLSPNAGHTFYLDGKKMVSKQIPISGIINDRNSQIYLTAGSVIDVESLFAEMDKFNIDPGRVAIHPRAAVVTKADKEEEARLGGIEKIASTQSGAGAARASKIMRTNPLAQGTPELKDFVKELDIHYYLRQKLSVVVETGQGVDLGLNFGLDYPHCTSRDVLPSAILADLGVHPKYMGNSMLTFRTYPIRVGNIVRDGDTVGDSGPFYPDTDEVSWGDLQVTPERTTVTNRIRRVGTFSIQQYRRSVDLVQPTHVFLNFINYVTEEDLPRFMFKGMKKPSVVGFGPHPEQICRWDRDTLRNYILKWC